MSTSLTIASQTISFISFSITLLTLLGVYRDLISTLRSAPTQMPLLLGNLRQEILSERAYLRQRCREGRDPFGVFPERVAGLPPGSRVSKKMRKARDGGEGMAYVRLLEVTMRDLWLEFRNLERPFLVRKGMRAEAIARGDYWGEEDVEAWGSQSEGDEKGGGRSGVRRRRGKGRGRGRGRRRGMAMQTDQGEWEAVEEDLRREGSKYYNTDVAHRFIWWQVKGDFQRLADQIQRIQIRRMERDLFETDELVRLLVRRAGLRDIGVAGRSPDGGGGGADSGSESESVGVTDGRSVVTRSRAGSRAASRRRSGPGRELREVEERGFRRRVTPSPAPAPRQSDNEANVAARRSERRRSGPRVEYEVLRPGSAGYVVVDDYRGATGRRQSIYEREVRSPDRGRSRGQSPTPRRGR
ncbi:uncharacterized protein HMPREF1541_09750 [Cyphellophora europaea CBS 101466]|uniref:Uncharacterized protein n=1 Tax=Cyphellophora europaea (strain CBS 101466) TaxID=1220924 RepID=W2S8D3_CYPE1|nr:uncharacterized protein HMPREF1541_09750 [Cyphellophora europaea CBS 101466]ETN44875.1 hypothetical protein HMPREF1541_09750 [Cyphellophora europaea CBS 101466]